MYKSCVDPALQVLEEVLDDLPRNTCDLKNSIQTMYLDLNFYKMFFWGLAHMEESSEDEWHSVLSNMMLEFEQTAEQFANEEKVTNWETMSCHLSKIIKQYKGLAKEICLLVLSGAFRFKSCQFEELFHQHGKDTASLIDFLVGNLQALDSIVDLIVPVKQQFAFIEGKLKVFGKFAYTAKDLPTRAMRLGELISHIRTWAGNISCLVCLYWIDKMDESLASSIQTMISDLMQRYMPYSPGVIALYLDVFMTVGYYKIQGDVPVIPQTLVVSYTDFLLEHLVTPTKDDVAIFADGLVLLLSFSVDPPKKVSEGADLILSQIYAILNEVPSAICFPETKFSSLLHKIDKAKVQVRELYVLTTVPSELHSPKTNVKGFLIFLSANLQKMLEEKVNFTMSVKSQIKIVQEELDSLEPLLQVNLELENEHKKLKDLWTQIADVAYFAAYVTNLCLSTSYFAWFGSIYLPNLIEEIKLVKYEVKKIEDGQIYSGKRLTAEMKSSNALVPQARTLKNEGVFIGFEQDVKDIQDHLVRGRQDLTIISISGMAGQGKTTLAKRIYDDPSIQYRFNKTAWLYVSKECKPRELLANILLEVVGSVDGNAKLDDLADSLRKSLKGKRYFIVLDDIWDAEVWRKVQGSFPNDSNESRILFTSRNHDLAAAVKPNPISHRLPFFTMKESLELIRAKFTNCEDLPPEFFEIGKTIAGYCKGLPLAVALVASHLRRTGKVLGLWKQVAEDLKSHLANEECMHIIELSYKYLQEHLKPCFLYFGAFPRGQNIRAKKLKLLWIAEGFIKDFSEDLAKKYLDNLVSQNLVAVTERSSTGGIKSCNVHDLIYDLCLARAVQDNFLHLADQKIVYSTQRYDFHQRLCVNENGPFTLPKFTCTRRRLPTSQVHTLLFNSETLPDSQLLSSGAVPYFVKSFKVLTVLDLAEIYLDIFPEVILYNIHLRYLALRGFFHDIPPPIVGLWNLETLIVVGTNVRFPDTLWEMKSLKYVDVDGFRLNLRGCWPNECSMIEVLGTVFLEYKLMGEMFLRSFSRLRKLKVEM